MKVVLFMTQFHQLNGAERLGVELAEALNARGGFQADLVSMYGRDNPDVPEAEEALRKRGIGRFFYLNLNVHPRPWPFFQAILHLRSLLKSEGYDVVETSQITPAIMACWASLGLKTRHVAGIHDVFSRDRYNAVRHRIWRFSIEFGRCDRFYAISEYVRQKWIEYSNTQEQKTEVVLNGIPGDCFEAVPDRVRMRGELGFPADARIALFVGRLLKRKGIDTVLDALGPILETHNLYLVYVGEWGYPAEGFFTEEDRLRERMETQIADAGWEDRVRFLGRRGDVPDLMAASDVLVHPARIEGFGLVLAEALAAGLPVVASNVQGIPEVLAGTDSIMTEPDDVGAVRASVEEILRRPPELAARAVEKGRARAECFRMENRINGLIRLFKSVSQP